MKILNSPENFREDIGQKIGFAKPSSGLFTRIIQQEI